MEGGNEKGLKGLEKMKFTDLIVWQKAHRLFLDLVKDVEGFPRRRAADIVANQILRSSSSISANIAEGQGRHKGREYEHYLIVARGSAAETEDWLMKCRDLGYMDGNRFEIHAGVIEEVLKMLNSMIGKIRIRSLR